MPSQFDYTINIPKPPVDNFMQDIAAFQQIRGMRAQQELARQLAPLQLQQAELGVQSQRQQMAQSAAAAARAAESFQLNKQAALAAQERERNVANMIAEYGLDPEKDLSALAPILPTLDKNRIDALRQVEAMKIGNAFQKIDPESPDPEAIRKLASRSLVLDTEQGKRLDGLLASLPDPAREKLVDTALQVSNAGIAGNNEVAKKRLEEVATAYSGSKDARFQQLGKLMTQTLESVPENATPSYWALLGQTLMFRTGDEKAIGKFNDILTNYSKETSPEAVAKTKAETMKAEAAAKLDLAKAEGGVDVKELPMGLQKIVNEGADNSETFTNLADKANSLATSLEGMRDKLGGGFLGRGKEALKAGVGAQDEVSAAIKATEALLNEDALARFKKVTSGAISDRETRTALGANPSVYGNPENTIEYLRALSNGAARAAKYEEAKSDWVSKFGTLTAAKQDTSIGDLSVKKGETFSEFRKRLAADLGRKKFYGAGSIDEQNNAERAKESRRVQQGAAPDFTGNEQDSLLRAAEVLRRLKTQ